MGSTAETNPTLFDIMIAIVGGVAGVSLPVLALILKNFLKFFLSFISGAFPVYWLSLRYAVTKPLNRMHRLWYPLG